jgi:hypothetical protein
VDGFVVLLPLLVLFGPDLGGGEGLREPTQHSPGKEAGADEKESWFPEATGLANDNEDKSGNDVDAMESAGNTNDDVESSLSVEKVFSTCGAAVAGTSGGAAANAEPPPTLETAGLLKVSWLCWEE